MCTMYHTSLNLNEAGRLQSLEYLQVHLIFLTYLVSTIFHELGALFGCFPNQSAFFDELAWFVSYGPHVKIIETQVKFCKLIVIL